jgi:hypothetical protein
MTAQSPQQTGCQDVGTTLRMVCDCSPALCLCVAGSVVAARCRELLDSFPTTSEEDTHMLATPEGAGSSSGGGDGAEVLGGVGTGSTPRLSEHLRLAVRYRLGKKLLLQHVMGKLQASSAAGSLALPQLGIN